MMSNKSNNWVSIRLLNSSDREEYSSNCDKDISTSIVGKGRERGEIHEDLYRGMSKEGGRLIS